MQVSKEVAEIINTVFAMAKDQHYEFVTPELVLYVTCRNQVFAEAFEDCGGNVRKLSKQLKGYLDEYMERTEEDGFQKRWERCLPMRGSLPKAVGKSRWD